MNVDDPTDQWKRYWLESRVQNESLAEDSMSKPLGFNLPYASRKP